MSGRTAPATPSSIYVKSVSPDGTPTVRQLSPAEAKQFVANYYENLELAWTISLLRQIFGVPDAKESERSKAARLLLAIKSNTKRLQKLKRDEMRRLGLITKPGRTEEIATPRADSPEDQAQTIALWRAFCKKAGDPFPMEDRVSWAREQLKDDLTLPAIVRYGLDLE